MNTEQVRQEIDHLSKLIEKRRKANNKRLGPLCSVICASDPDLNFLTPEERDRFHELKLQLPSQWEEVQAAKARLAARVADRKRRVS